jgi:hypothetical protein
VTVRIDVSPGDLWDRITILELKATRLGDPAARMRARSQLAALQAAANSRAAELKPIVLMVKALRAVNQALWRLENDLRNHERRGSSPVVIAACAIAIRRANDKRAAVRRRINDHLGCAQQDEKQYASRARR